MEIIKVEENKNEYMKILLEADPDENIVNKYQKTVTYMLEKKMEKQYVFAL